WQRETEGRVFDSPERRAALDKALAETVRTIPCPKVRDQYRKSLQARMAALVESALVTETVPAPVTVPLYMLIREEETQRECGQVTIEFGPGGQVLALRVTHFMLPEPMLAFVDPDVLDD
ncbi:MAG: hypothetical protein OXI46_05700, partial [Gemmatimonadota bacterium]|nr:hypothetical protein [Gemmatimonadota bacterium]